MATTIQAGTMFPAEVVTDLFSKVRGKSSLAVLSDKVPVAFSGNDLFTFSMDEEVNIVGESGAHAAGETAVETVKMRPVKVEYGTRLSDEFMVLSEEKQIEMLKEFNEGFARKAARGLDIMAMHGLNPRTDATSPQITQYFDKGTLTVDFVAGKSHDNVEDAVALLGDYDCTGIALSKTMAADLAKLENKNGGKLYPELSWGGQPKALNGLDASVNSTVSFGKDTKDMVIVGDFRNFFKWGFAKDVKMEIIPYGDPDNTGKDLKGNGEIYIRAQCWIGWGIMDEKAFARVVKTA